LIRVLKKRWWKTLLKGFGRGLLDGGVALHSISLGGMLLHPVFGALGVVWDATDETVFSTMMPAKLSRRMRSRIYLFSLHFQNKFLINDSGSMPN